VAVVLVHQTQVSVKTGFGAKGLVVRPEMAPLSALDSTRPPTKHTYEGATERTE
jgi:hypothetical protein